MDITIRSATEADAEAIDTIHRELGWFHPFGQEPPAQTRERLRRHIALCAGDNRHGLYVAVDRSDSVLGYIAVHWLPYLFLKGQEGYVSELFVAESNRGQGIGSRLLDAVTREARARGCARLMLINSRDRDSYRRGFYRKLGWVEREGMANWVLDLEEE